MRPDVCHRLRLVDIDEMISPSARNCTGGFPSILQQNCDNPLISWKCSSSKLASIFIVFSYLSAIGIVRFRDCCYNLIVRQSYSCRLNREKENQIATSSQLIPTFHLNIRDLTNRYKRPIID